MRNQPTVSVCIANYNGMGIIDGCIASVLAQNCEFPVEIIVHDDASTDGSVPHIREHYPQVRLLESAGNVGFCVANNRMAGAATGEYLLLLNNDAELYPDALSTLLNAARTIGQPAILSLPQYDFDSGNLIDIGCLVDPFLNPVPNTNPERHAVATVMGACFWIPKSLWRELGGFPEWFGSIGEDLYLCHKARLAGHQVSALGLSGYRHRVGGSFGGGKVRGGRLITTWRRRALSERNKTFVMTVCYPSFLLVCLLPVHLVLIHLEGLLLTLTKRDSSIWRNIYAPLLPALWSQRKRLRLLRGSVQSQRSVSLCSLLAPVHWMPWKLQMLARHGLPRIT